MTDSKILLNREKLRKIRQLRLGLSAEMCTLIEVVVYSDLESNFIFLDDLGRSGSLAFKLANQRRLQRAESYQQQLKGGHPPKRFG